MAESSSRVGVIRIGAVLSRRRRREDVQRERRVTVRFSEEEYAQLVANAATARLAVAAYLAELGTVPLEAVPAQRRGGEERAAVLVELMGAHRQLRGAATNLNQAVARWHATGERPGELAAVAAYVRRVAARVDAAVAAVVESR